MSVALTDSRLEEKFQDVLGALAAVLEDEAVCDVMVNADGRVFVERVGEQMVEAPLRLTEKHRSALIRTAVAAGGGVQREGYPILETRIPGRGWRFEGLVPPVVEAPALSIRKPARHVYPLRSYVESGRMSEHVFEVLRAAVVERLNVLVVGGTGTGKTTLANALLAEVAGACPEQRVLVLEDTPELRCASPNSLGLTVSQWVGMLDLLKASMRLRPDRIVVGEVRGAEVTAMLSAWNTGHPGGICTVHANSARGGLLRLEQLCAQAGAREGARLEIAQAVQMVVCIERHEGVRRVREVLRVDGLAGGDFVCSQV